jgi:hypothetical protein
MSAPLPQPTARATLTFISGLDDIYPSQLVRVGRLTVRLYPTSSTQADVRPDWPGRNRKERRAVMKRARKL